MMTALLILVLVLFVGCTGLTVYGLARGCPFAWLWFCFGGLESAGEVIGELLKAIAEGLSGN